MTIDSRHETNPYTKRLVKKCKEGEERIPREDGNFKTFKCYKKCKSNQMRNMGTMRCRNKQYESPSSFRGTRNTNKMRTPTVEYNVVYPSPSSTRGSNDLRKTKKAIVDYNLYPSTLSIRGSNDLRKTKKSKPSSKVGYNVYPSPSPIRGSNELRKNIALPIVDYDVYPSPSSVHGSNSMSKKTKLKLKVDAMRSKKTLQKKGRDWFWGEKRR